MPVTLCLLKPIARAVDWIPFAAVVPATLALALATGDEVQSFNLAATIRLCALLLGAAAGFALVDPVAVVTPVPRWVRQWLRTALAFAAASFAWCAVFSVLASRSAEGVDLGIGGYALEAAVCVVAGLACTAVVAFRRGGERSTGAIGAAVLLAFAASTLFYEGRVWPLPEEPDWAPVHRAWLVAAVVPVVVLTIANSRRAGGPNG